MADIPNPLVSICIPTRNRPEFLRQAVESCLAQSYRNIEIIISDDSDRAMSVPHFADNQRVQIRYSKNDPPLGQAGNVNRLFELAQGERLVLLHDDDWLMPGAIQILADCWTQEPDLAAAFGMQKITDDSGEVLPQDSNDLNWGYHRTTENVGLVRPGLAGIIRMFPNDGFMILTQRARQVGYRPFEQVGAVCDTDFGIRYCADNVKVWFSYDYTSVYRLSNDAVSKSSITAPYLYEILSEYRAGNPRLEPCVSAALDAEIRKIAPRAATGYARLGKRLRALRLLASSDYAWREKLRFRFTASLALVCVSTLDLRGSRGLMNFINTQISNTRH